MNKFLFSAKLFKQFFIIFSMGEVKALIFDVGGVLAIGSNLKQSGKKGHSHSIHESVAKKLNLSLDQYFDSIDTAYSKSIEGKIDEKALLTILSKNLKVSKRKIKNLFEEEYERVFRQNVELYKFAFQKKKEGYKIAILSDQWHLSYGPLVPKKYSKKFDVEVISCFEGLRKPDLRIYQLTIKKLGIRPAQGVFIDNQEWNTSAAKKAGIPAVLFKNNKQLFKQLKSFGI